MNSARRWRPRCPRPWIWGFAPFTSKWCSLQTARMRLSLNATVHTYESLGEEGQLSADIGAYNLLVVTPRDWA